MLWFEYIIQMTLSINFFPLWNMMSSGNLRLLTTSRVIIGKAFTFDTWLKGDAASTVNTFLTYFHALKFHVMKLANPWHSMSSNDLNVNTLVEGFSSLRKLLLRWQKYGSPTSLIWSRFPIYEKLAYELPQFCWLVGSSSLRTLKLHHPGYLAPPKGPAGR